MRICKKNVNHWSSLSLCRPIYEGCKKRVSTIPRDQNDRIVQMGVKFLFRHGGERYVQDGVGGERVFGYCIGAACWEIV